MTQERMEHVKAQSILLDIEEQLHLSDYCKNILEDEAGATVHLRTAKNLVAIYKLQKTS